MNILPAIDLRGGRVVRLEQGRSDRETEYGRDPGAAALRWQEAGASWVHAVDLDGAFEGESRNLDALRAIAASGLKVQFGGGMRDRAAVEAAFAAGASRVVIGSRAATDPQFMQELVAEFGTGIAAGVDARNGKVAVRGWVDTLETDAVELIAGLSGIGVATVVYTDISRDGMLGGPNFQAYRELLESVPVGLIASGGIGSLEDIQCLAQMAEQYPLLVGAITGKALYDGRIDLREALNRVH